MLSIFIAILVFGLIIMIHEAGHFLLAKMNGVTVLEFSVGMGPRIFSLRRGGTTYSIKALPIGGSCALLGEEDDNPAEGAFHNKGVVARMAVVAAGPSFNFLLTFLLSFIMVVADGYSVAGIRAVTEGSAADEAGLKACDIIKEINGEKMVIYRDYLLYWTLRPDAKIEKLQYERDMTGTGAKEKEKETVHMIPRYDKESDRYLAGITIRPVKVKADSLGEIIKYGFYEVKYNIAVTLKSLEMLLIGRAGIRDLAGPVGITSIIDDSIKAGMTVSVYGAVINVLNISILLSANLGIMNLLPIPVLDGGRILLLCLEGFRRKRLNRKAEKMMYTVSMAVLLSLMFLVVLFDIGRILKL